MAKYVSGAKGVRSAFIKLPSAITTPVNEASRFALQPILKTAKSKIKEMDIRDSGELLKAMTIKRNPRRPKSKPEHLVGPRSDSPAARYAHLQEFGTEPHNGHPGQQPRPFLTESYAQHDEEAVKRFGEKIGPAVEKSAAKLAKKQGKSS